MLKSDNGRKKRRQEQNEPGSSSGTATAAARKHPSAPKEAQELVDDNSKMAGTDFIKPRDQDVLFGRGKYCVRHNAGTIWAKMCDEYTDKFEKAEEEEEKRQLVEYLVDKVMAGPDGARFLEEDKEHSEDNKEGETKDWENMKWKPVSRVKVIAKTRKKITDKKKEGKTKQPKMEGDENEGPVEAGNLQGDSLGYPYDQSYVEGNLQLDLGSQAAAGGVGSVDGVGAGVGLNYEVGVDLSTLLDPSQQQLPVPMPMNSIISILNAVINHHGRITSLEERVNQLERENAELKQQLQQGASMPERQF